MRLGKREIKTQPSLARSGQEMAIFDFNSPALETRRILLLWWSILAGSSKNFYVPAWTLTHLSLIVVGSSTPLLTCLSSVPPAGYLLFILELFWSKLKSTAIVRFLYCTYELIFSVIYAYWSRQFPSILWAPCSSRRFQKLRVLLSRLTQPMFLKTQKVNL